MLKIIATVFLMLVLAVATAAAQTATTTTTSSSHEGAYDKLSPGNQKITLSMFNAQQGDQKLSLDDIAALKQSGKGWGVIFKDMKANGQLPSDVKNLGQLVSGKYHPASGTTGGTTITSGSGKSHVVGSSAKAGVTGKSGKGHFDDGAGAGAKGSGSLSTASGGGFGHGNSGAGGSRLGHGGGKGK